MRQTRGEMKMRENTKEVVKALVDLGYAGAKEVELVFPPDGAGDDVYTPDEEDWRYIRRSMFDDGAVARWTETDTAIVISVRWN